MTEKQVETILDLLDQIGKIDIDFFGINLDKNCCDTWESYMDSQYEDAKTVLHKTGEICDLNGIIKYFRKNYRYTGIPKCLVFDPNESNYIFDDCGNIRAIIDVDHLMGGDPLWQLGCILYHRPQYYKIISKRNTKNMDTIKIYALLNGFNDIHFRMVSSNESLEFYITQFSDFLKFINFSF